MFLSVTASAANLLIPSWSLSNAIWSSRRDHLNSGSLSMKLVFAMGSALAAVSGDRRGESSPSAFCSFSRSAGAIVRKSQPVSSTISSVC